MLKGFMNNDNIYVIVGRAITIREAIQKRSHESIYKTYAENEAKGLRAITKGGAKEKSSILLLQYWRN